MVYPRGYVYPSAVPHLQPSHLDLTYAVLEQADLSGSTGLPAGYQLATFASVTCPTGVASDVSANCEGQF